jgi:PGF-CTERM protein
MSKTKAIQILVMALVLVSLFASISIASASNPKARILIDDYHGADLGSGLKNELTDRRFEIEVNTDTPLDSIALGKYNVLVIAIPDKEISETEINAVLNFVDDGGGLLLLGESGGVIDSMDNLSENFGIVFNRDTLKDPTNRCCASSWYPGNDRMVIVHSFISHPITKDIKSIAYYHHYQGYYGCTLSLSGSASALAIGDDDSYSEVYEEGSCPPVLAVSHYGDGKVVGYGCYHSWLKDPETMWAKIHGGLADEDKDNKQLALSVFHYLSDATTIDPSTTHIFVEVEEGKSAEYIFTLNNIDTMDAENVRLTVDGEAKEWISLSDNNFDIDGFSEKDITITIALPEGTEVGTYNAEMSMSSSNAAAYKGKDKISFLVSVERFNEPPVADAGEDKIVYVGEEVNFDASSSYDSDGSIVSYEWDFGDSSTDSGETVTHKYSEQGDYTAILTVTDNDGANDTDKIFVHVKGEEVFTPEVTHTATLTPTPAQIVTPTETPETITPLPTTFPESIETPPPTISKPGGVNVYLHGEKTDVWVGEDIILSLSAVNLITKPTMTLQLILKVPSGMSITSTEFIESGAGMYTATYTVEPGKERHIGVNIKTNQVGDFNVEGAICYYFGRDKSTAEYKNVKLPVKANPIPTPTGTTPTSSQTETPGFEAVFAIAGLLAVAYSVGRKK